MAQWTFDSTRVTFDSTLDALFDLDTSGSNLARTIVADNIPPSVPNLAPAVVVGAGEIDLTWPPSVDNVAVALYRAYANGALVASGVTSPYKFPAAANTFYQLGVSAVDTVGNESAYRVLTATTPALIVPTPTLAASNGPGTAIFTASYAGPPPLASYTFQYGTQVGLFPNSVTQVSPVLTVPASVTTYCRVMITTSEIPSRPSNFSLTQSAIGVSAPGTPTFSATTASQTQVTWTAAAGVAGYETQLNNGAFTDRGNVLTYLQTGLAGTLSDVIGVRAYDAAGNRSATSSATVLIGATALFQQPNESRITADLTLWVPLASAPPNGPFPVGQWGLVLWQPNPFTAGGKLVPNTHDVGALTGFVTTTPSTAQLGFQDAAGSTTAQMEGGTVGAYINSADLGVLPQSPQKMMITPEYIFNSPAPVPFAQANAVMASSLNLKLPTATGASTYWVLDYQFVGPGGVLISLGVKLFSLGIANPVVGSSLDIPSGSYQLNVPLGDFGSSPKPSTFITPTGNSTLTQSATWSGTRLFSFTMTRAQFVAALNYLIGLYPGVVTSNDPALYSLVKIHGNAETTFTPPATATLGWSMDSWTSSTSSSSPPPPPGTDNYPRLGGHYSGGTQKYDSGFQSHAARKHIISIGGGWPGWQSAVLYSKESVIRSIKSQSKVNTRVFQFQGYSNVWSADPLWIDACNRNATWQLKNNGNPVTSDGGVVVVDQTTAAHNDGPTGLSPYGWAAKYANDMYHLGVYSGSTGTSAAPSVDGFLLDNLFWTPRATGNWLLDGVNRSPGDPALQVPFLTGQKKWFDELAQIFSTGIHGGNVTDWAGATPLYGGSGLGPLGGVPRMGLHENVIGSFNSPENQGPAGFVQKEFAAVIDNLSAPKYLIFTHNFVTTSGADPYGPNWQAMRNGICACLMNNGYYYACADPNAYNDDGSNHLWFDEYDGGGSLGVGYLGQPSPGAVGAVQTAAWSNGVWKREFANGIVLWNPRFNGAQTVSLSGLGNLKHFSGSQNSGLNNGSTVTNISLQDRDGVILLRF